MKSGPRQTPVKMSVHDAWLDYRVSIAKIHLFYFAHPREDDHHAATDRKTAAGKTRSGPTGHERQAEFIANLHNGRHFCRIFRKDGDVRAMLFDNEGVTLVDGQIRMRIKHMICADNPPQSAGY